jgi:hypothetical protein
MTSNLWLICRVLAVALALSAGHAAGLAAQGRSKCGNLENPQPLLQDWYAPAFYEPESAQWRAETGIETLDASTPAEVVTNQTECRRVMRAAIRVFRAWPNWNEIHRNGYEFQVYRIGPYYAVHQSDLPPKGVMWLTYISNLQVFRADTLEHLGGLAFQL